MHKVWVADDDEAIGLILEESLRNAGFDTKIFSNGEDLLEDLEKDQPDLIITDVQMPGMLGYDVLKHINNNYEDLPVIIMTAFADMQAAVDSFGSGAFEYIPKPFDLDETIKIINRALEEKPKTKGLKKDTKLDIVGESLPMQNVFRSIGKLSNTIATVLIQGESGTGKELIAKSLHKNSPRHDMPFIALNMADIPKELVESELFGHEKGAFTGAVDKRVGRFEQANGGTLFLDEIGDMHPELQTRLLRVLSSHEFYRVGGQKPIKSDVRIIAATNQNIEALIKTGKFREDLYHRLNVFRIELPALRDRKDDIDDLVKHFLTKSADELKSDSKEIDDNALEILNKYDWPGNIRQLENICRYMTVMAPSSTITIDDVPDEVREEPSDNGLAHEGRGFDVKSSWEENLTDHIKTVLSDGNDLSGFSKELERLLLKEALAASKGKRIEAAKILGLGRNTITR